MRRFLLKSHRVHLSLSLSLRSQTPILMLMNLNFDPTKRAIQTAVQLFLQPIRQTTLPSELLKGLLFIMFFTSSALLSTDIHVANTTNLCAMCLCKLLHTIYFIINMQGGVWSPIAPLLHFATFFHCSFSLQKACSVLGALANPPSHAFTQYPPTKTKTHTEFLRI